jgi:autotransporter-associated beta strand protein
MNRSQIAVRRWASVHVFVLALCIVVQWTGPVAFAATFDGHSGINPNWSTPTNWVGNVVPVSGNPNLEVRLASTGTPAFTSIQDLGAPFELQMLSINDNGAFTNHTVNGAPLAFSNLGAAPSIRPAGFFSPNLTVNSDMVLNADVTVTPNVGIGTTIPQYSLNGAISGIGSLRQTGGGDVHLGGMSANSYAGVTIMDNGVLTLNKPASVVAVPGDLVINTGGSTRDRRGTVIVANDDQIAVDAKVTINRGQLLIEGGDQTLANIEFVGANGPLNPDGGRVVISPSRTLTITGGITRASSSPAPVFPQNLSLISGGMLDLAGGLRPFHVDNDNPIGLPTTLTVSSVIANGGIEKTGVGVLHLSEAKNTFTGNVLVSGGLFSVGQNGELMFDLENAGASNRILGTADAFLNGVFRLDPAGVTDISSSWNLVDVANLNETFGSEFKLQFVGGTTFTNLGGGVYRSGRWKFTTADGNLTLSAVPEPAGLVVAALGGLALVGRRRGGCRLTAFAAGA